MGSISASLERSAHLIGTYLDPTVSELGITQGEAHVLAQLARRGPTAIGALHREFGHKRSTLTNILDRLERRKLLRREINPADRRSFLVQLTAPGRRTAARITEALDQLERALAARVDKRALTGLDKAVGALEEIVLQDATSLRQKGSS